MDSKEETTVALEEIWKAPTIYSFCFANGKIPKWVDETLYVAGNCDFPRYLGINSSRSAMRSTLNKAVRYLKLWAPYLVAAYQWENNCIHTKEEMRSGSFKNCECYRMARKDMGENFEKVLKIFKHGSNKDLALVDDLPRDDLELEIV